MSCPHLTEADVRSLLDPTQLIPALEAGFRDRYPSISLPQRTLAELDHGIFLAMSCYDCGANALGIKLVMLRDQAQRGRDNRNAGPLDSKDALTEGRVQATYLLLDPETAQP